MSKSSKFGTFGGVFTPSILTILGVIMYLRLPWVVGNSGLYMAIGVIVVAHIISITTGLSISSIATDKNVGAGGPYYIVSRSLGLPIGGTLGIALFLGLSFSISLYVIGFCESFLSFLSQYPQFGIDPTDPATIRVAGTITIAFLTGVTLISTSFAIKTQYLILVAIALSLVSIFFGSPVGGEVQSGGHLQPVQDAPSLGIIFGIFFPAVTGFTAGVNMSGDLKDPKRSIPGGTMAAISVGMVVYIGLAIFLAFRLSPESLVGNTNILVDMAWIPSLVIAGIWGATLSSALGSILGAPRILQALSADSITPKIFAKGTGKTNEPRNAMVLAFLIGEAGILIAELDVIARVVSMVFLATYGFLNISSAIESWASPDFRPSFRIPRLVSVIGAATSALVMIQLDFAAMAGATVILSATFLFLKRKQLTLDAGDTWEGIWSSIVRAGLHRLSQGRGQRRNWRPNVLVFSQAGAKSRTHLLGLAQALITGNGLLTDFELVDPKRTDEAANEGDPAPVGVFRRRTPSEDYYETVGSAARHHGFSGLDPNTVLLEWDVGRNNRKQYAELIQNTIAQDFNLLLLHHDPERGWGERKRIDIWWRPRQGNVSLSLALMRFLTRYEQWHEAELRFLLVSEDTSLSDDLLHTMRTLLAEARVEGKVKVVALPSRQGFESTVRQESSDADLVVLGLPQVQRLDDKRLEKIDELVESLGSTLILRGSDLFTEVLPVANKGLSEAVERAQLSATELRPLKFPEHPDLEKPAAAFAEHFGRMTEELFTQTLAPILGRYETLLKDVTTLVQRQFEIARKGADAEGKKARKPAGKAQGGFLFQARKQLQTFEEEVLPSQARNLKARLDSLEERLAGLDVDAPKQVRVPGRAEDFEPSDTDSRWLRKFKKRKRFWAKFRRRAPIYVVPVATLQRYYVWQRATELLEDVMRSVQSSSYRLVVQLGKLLNATSTELNAVLDVPAHHKLDPEAIAAAEKKVLGYLDAASELARDLTDGIGTRISQGTHGVCQAYCRDLERIDAIRLVKQERRPPKKPKEKLAPIVEIPETWSRNQDLLLQRAQLGLQLAAFQHRFSVVVKRVRNDVNLQVRGSVLGEAQGLLDRIKGFATAIEKGERPEIRFETELNARFESQEVLETLARDMDAAVDDLPDAATTLSDETIASMESGIEVEVEEVNVSVRPLVRYLVETEFLDVINQEISGLPLAEQRTASVGQDVTRLLSFSLGDLDAVGGWSNEAARSQLVSVAKEGAVRLDREVTALRGTLEGFSGRVDDQLEVLRENTDPYALTSRSDSLSQYIRSQQGAKAVSRVRAVAIRVAEYARKTFVALLYRRSSGVLLAKRLRRLADESTAPVADRIVSLTSSTTPRAGVFKALPFYYRQLFSGQATISDTFWVGRQAELERARQAVRRHEQGGHGALFVVGETGAGKTALCHVIATKYLARRKLFRISPPPGGTIEKRALTRAVESALNMRGDIDSLLAKAPDGSVFVFDDLELWWERTEEGNTLLELFADLVRKHGDRLLFIANLNVHAWRFVQNFVRLSEIALTVVECDPLPAEDLKSIISLRHGSTGLEFTLAGTDETDLAPWRQARLFTKYFDFSGGLIAVALRAWLAHIDKVDGNNLVMRWPEHPRTGVISELRIELQMLLLQLVLHKQVTARRLARIVERTPEALETDLGPLVRMGLIRRDNQDVMHVDRFVAHFVTSRLRTQGMLA